MSGGPLVVVGDALLDRDLVGRARRLAPDAPVPVVDDVRETERPGGAGLAALLAALDGREVVLVTALGDDAAGERLRRSLGEHVAVVALPLLGPTPEKTRVRVDGQTLVRVDRGDDATAVGEPGADVAAALASAGVVLVADYGRGVAAQPRVRDLLTALPPRLPVVWDPHPRGAPPTPGVRLATPNAAEALALAPGFVAGVGASPAASLAVVSDAARALVSGWRAGAVAVTLGARGALLAAGEGSPLVVPAPQVACLDPCGAGDRFASSAAGLLLDGALPSEAVVGAVQAASAFVAAGGAAAVQAAGRSPAVGLAVGPAAGAIDEVTAELAGVRARAVVERTRRAGGTVVATGGCFDLLHAGHVATLDAARSLGDCLVVLVNSDDSVRRLKGPARPLVPAEDRVRVLEALASVDAVAVFDESTPERALRDLRPDIWAKGGDYAGTPLPEAAVLAEWGGQAVVLPYLGGRSTTRLVAIATAPDSLLGEP